jgi:hypothetical protein
MTPRRRRVLTVVLVVAIALMPMGIAVAQSLTHTATAGTVYSTNSGVEVTLTDQRQVTATPFPASDTFSDQNVTISGTNAAVSIGDNTYSGSPVTVTDVSASGSVRIERSDLNRPITLESGSANTLQIRNYTVGNGAADLAYDSSGGFNATLEGLPSDTSIAVVDVSTGSPLTVVATDASGVATFDLPSGTRNVRLERAPGEITVRNETAPNQLVTGTNLTLTARLFAGGDTVIQRPVTNGTVSLDGLPKDERIVVTVREENADFVYRRILLESAVETSDIYVLPTNEPAAQVRFSLRDDTGRFDPADTRFFVEKPVARDFDGDGTNETRYQVISGDQMGADNEFPTILVDSQRYRLRVENDEGEQRVLGSYVVQGATRAVIPIGDVEFTADVSEGAAMQASIREAPDSASYDHEARVVYLDPEAKTESINLSITDQNGNQLRPSTTEQIDKSGEPYVETFPIINASFEPAEDTATVDIQANREGSTLKLQRNIGALPDLLKTVPIDPRVMELIGLVSIVAVVGLLVIQSPRVAALVGPGYAGLLSVVGLVGIPLPAVVLAGLIGVVAVVGSTAGRL